MAWQKCSCNQRDSIDGRIGSAQAYVEWSRTPPRWTARCQAEDDVSIFGASQYTKRRAVREHYQARLAKIEYEERVAKLTPWMAFG